MNDGNGDAGLLVGMTVMMMMLVMLILKVVFNDDYGDAELKIKN